MDQERWSQIEGLFQCACECDPVRRPRLVEQAAAGDPELRRIVEELLTSEERAAQDLRAAVYGALDALAFPLVGETISHYRVLAGIGSGGMGSVYKAEDLKLGRAVALKFLPDELTRDPVALKRLEREARAASALNHPNVCTIYEIAEHLGRPFIVMEILEGETLRERISGQKSGDRPVALEQQLDLGIQIGAALAAAHARGIVHRDIKPANIFITRAGTAKILDFGVAKLTLVVTDADAEREGIAGEVQTPELPEWPVTYASDSSLTRTGVTIGTAGYMSPEQVRGEALDGRSDLFSFGLVLYEMATGRPAFGAGTPALARDAILHSEAAPVREVNPSVPQGLALIIRKALEKDRHQRYQSAAEMRAALESLRSKTTRGSQYRSRTLLAAGLALLVTVASIWIAWRPAAQPPSPNLNLQQLTTNSWENPVTGGALSPDGHYVAYTDSKGVHVKVVGSDSAQLVPRPPALRADKVVWDIQSYAWFPDSRQFVATSHPPTEQSIWAPLNSSISTIWVIPASGGVPRKLRDAAIAWAVSPDGSMIGFGTNRGPVGNRELWVMRSDGEQARSILQADAGGALCCLYFFQDGKRISYVTTDHSGDRFVTQDLSGGPVATVMGQSVTLTHDDLVWLPDGRLIYSDCFPAGSCTYSMARFDIRSGRMTDAARRLTTVVGSSVHGASGTPDGRLVAFTRETRSGTSYVADIEAGTTRVGNAIHFTLDEGDEAIYDWTPDSRTAIVGSNRGNYSALYTQALGGDVAEPIITRNEKGLLERAMLSPDSGWIILLIWPLPVPPGPTPPQQQVWGVPRSGGALRQLFSLVHGSDISCARAPATLCVTAEPTADRKQFVVSAFDPATGARGGELLRFDRYLNPDDEPGPLAFALSPDGQRVATSTGPAGPLRILSLHGDSPRVLSVSGLNVKQSAAWTADGRGLIVTTYRDDAAVLLHVDLEGNVQELFKCESAATCFGVPSPDGKRLGIYQTRPSSNIWMLGNL